MMLRKFDRPLQITGSRLLAYHPNACMSFDFAPNAQQVLAQYLADVGLAVAALQQPFNQVWVSRHVFKPGWQGISNAIIVRADTDMIHTVYNLGIQYMVMLLLRACYTDVI